ncbi:peptidase S1, partial [Klebsiella oxytoca]
DSNIDDVAAAMYGMPRGVYIYKIIEGGAAGQSDLREKDIITKFDGQAVRSMEDLQTMLTYYEGGATVAL